MSNRLRLVLTSLAIPAVLWILWRETRDQLALMSGVVLALLGFVEAILLAVELNRAKIGRGRQ